MNLPEKIYVTVTYPGGFISFFAHWWQNDESIVRSARRKLGALAPRSEDCAVERSAP